MAGVLVLGATGYIGLAVAQAARRDGCMVYAQTRSADKATLLAANELIPVLVHDPTDAKALIPLVKKCEFVIDCTSNMANPTAIPEACIEAMKLCSSKKSGIISKKHFLYTSGALVHGPRNAGEVVTEDDIMDESSLPVMAERIKLEASLLANHHQDNVVDCTVLRPAFVYGKKGGMIATRLFTKPAGGDTLQIGGDPNKRWSWVHVDDLADGYIRVLHRRSIAAGRAYDLCEPFGPTYEELKVAASKLMGFEGKVEYVKAEGFEAFFDFNIVVNCKRARDELDWVPKQVGIMAHLQIYCEAYKAANCT